jgi:hypothetical protein
MSYIMPPESVMKQLDSIMTEITEYHQAKREHRYARALACVFQAGLIAQEIVKMPEWKRYIGEGGR